MPFKYSEIIFIAGGIDKTLEICNSIKLDNFDNVLTVIQETSDFKSGALIKGMKKSIGDIVVIIDADTLVAPNLIIEVSKALRKFDAVNSDYIPMIQKGFWYNYYIINKLCWAKNSNNLTTLFGGATISIRRDVINEIGVTNFFTNKSTAGVDYYMGLILRKKHKKLGIVKSTRVITPRPGNLKDFSKDNSRWFSAFFQIHYSDMRMLLNNLLLSLLFILFPPLLFMFNMLKMKGLQLNITIRIKYFLTIFFTEYILNILRIKAILRVVARRFKKIEHFKGARY